MVHDTHTRIRRSHKWYGNCRAVRTDGAAQCAHTDDRSLHHSSDAMTNLPCPVLCFLQFVLLFLTCVVINIMHIHDAFHFSLISENYHVLLCMWITYH